MEVHKVKPNEIEALSRLAKQTYIDHYSHIRSRKGLKEHLERNFEFNKLSSDAHDPSTWFYFVTNHQKKIGYLKVKLNSPNPINAQSGLELEKIYFLKGFTGQGFGKKSIDFVKSLAQENKQKCIWLDVIKNKPNAIRFYERMGFAKLGEIPFATDILDIGMWVMAKKLS